MNNKTLMALKAVDKWFKEYATCYPPQLRTLIDEALQSESDALATCEDILQIIETDGTVTIKPNSIIHDRIKRIIN